MLGAIIGAAGSLLGGIMGNNAADRAANQQMRAANHQLNFAKRVYADQNALFQPWRDMGMQGQQAYMSELGLGNAPAGYKGFSETPGYQYNLNQGLDAAQSAAAARGGMLSGATLQSMQTVGNGLANNEYQTYMNRLQGVGTQGQAAAGNQATAAQNYGQNAINAAGNYGDAAAAGTIGGYNALSSGINGAISSFGYLNGAQQGGTQAGGLGSLFNGQNFLGGW